MYVCVYVCMSECTYVCTKRAVVGESCACACVHLRVRVFVRLFLCVSECECECGWFIPIHLTPARTPDARERLCMRSVRSAFDFAAFSTSADSKTAFRFRSDSCAGRPWRYRPCAQLGGTCALTLRAATVCFCARCAMALTRAGVRPCTCVSFSVCMSVRLFASLHARVRARVHACVIACVSARA
jgi:hypothetical protein